MEDNLFSGKLTTIQRLVREGNYVMTHHAFDEMIADDLRTRDVEQIIMSGSIIRVEIDKPGRERKYVIFGKSIDGSNAEVIAKIAGKVVIITVYLL